MKRRAEKPNGYEGWTKQFTGLDKYDANKSESARVAYTYRVLESASAGGIFTAARMAM